MRVQSKCRWRAATIRQIMAGQHPSITHIGAEADRRALQGGGTPSPRPPHVQKPRAPAPQQCTRHTSHALTLALTTSNPMSHAQPTCAGGTPCATQGHLRDEVCSVQQPACSRLGEPMDAEQGGVRAGVHAPATSNCARPAAAQGSAGVRAG